MPKTCPHCKSSDLDVDPARGDTVCMGCGSVLEENAIVSEVLFSENADGSSSVVGQFVSTEGHNKPHFTGFRHGMSKESRQQTLDRGRREITEMAAQLHLNRHCVDTAYNFFKMAINKRLSRGRRIQHIVAACLYMTCRTEGTPHMLLDFSDVTEVNVFTLGKAFLVLAKELHIHLPVLGYLGRKRHFTEVGRFSGSPVISSYWNPGSRYDHWSWNSKAGSTVVSIKMMKETQSMIYPRLTDDRNLKASTLSNTFSATTRVREVPVSGIYKKEIQEFRCRSPSARGVRSVPITNRSLVATQSTKSTMSTMQTLHDRGQIKGGSYQVARIMKEQERLERTREMKRHAQIASHRMDRMYYMNGAPAPLHSKYDVTHVDLERLQAIAISRGIKISQAPPSGHYSRKSTSTVPNSSPRHESEDIESGTKTIIPTADVMSVGDVMSEDDEYTRPASSGKEDAATSDHGDEDLNEQLDLEEQQGSIHSDQEESGSIQAEVILPPAENSPRQQDDSSKIVQESKESDVKSSEVSSSIEHAFEHKGQESEVKDLLNESLEAADDSDTRSVKSDSALLSPKANISSLGVSGAFLTDLAEGDGE